MLAKMTGRAFNMIVGFLGVVFVVTYIPVFISKHAEWRSLITDVLMVASIPIALVLVFYLFLMICVSTPLYADYVIRKERKDRADTVNGSDLT